MMMQFGHFDDHSREYVITRPDTPLPWINYLGCEDYFGIISNTAGGYSFFQDARLRRLTRYRYNNAPLDMGGRYLYLRDNEVKDSKSAYWSPTWMPTRTPLDFYECRHGMGYTIIRSSFQKITSRIKYFVPLGENLEIWEMTLKNERDIPTNLSVFSAIEFCLWDAQDDANNFQRNYSIGEVEVEDGVIYHKSEYRERRNHFAYFTCSEPLAGYDTRREDFLGRYRGWDSPLAVESGKSSGKLACGWQPIGSHQIAVTLKPGEEKKLIFLLGYAENAAKSKFDPPGSQTINKKEVKPVITKYLQHQEVENAFDRLHEYWSEVLGKFQVSTPDEHTNRMVNIWNAYQCMVTFNMSRSASYFESGVGRGMGFRDSNQDVLGFVHMVPERARERILNLAATQLPDGGAYHQYQTLTKRGNNDIGSNFNDDPLWLVIAVCAYLRETGDKTILKARVPYDNKPGTEATLYDHIKRSIRYTLKRLGPHDLPLIGHADWNDCLNLNCFSDQPGQSFQTTTTKDGKSAESVFIGGLFVLAADEMAELADWMGLKKEAILYRSAAEKMKTTVLEAGWDGSWFRRAYDFFGKPVGSHLNQEGQIFIEPQGMCVMAGIGVQTGQAKKALESVSSRLATSQGIMLVHPAFTHYYLNLGEITSYPPGYKENGSIFCHTNPWVMIAETKLGHGDKAHDYYLRINPSARERISEVHRCEPYVYAQMIASKASVAEGEAKNSWLTGTASWNYVAITQWILGIRPAYTGLMISPVMPSSWNGFDAVRIYRGVRYIIHVERKGTGNHIQHEVGGRLIEGTLIPLPPSGTKEVQVTTRVF